MNPQVSSFFGIIISMYYDDHNPPHFHASYQDNEAQILIENFSLYRGTLPPKAFALVIERAIIHKQELLKNRETMIQNKHLAKIEPLS